MVCRPRVGALRSTSFSRSCCKRYSAQPLTLVTLLPHLRAILKRISLNMPLFMRAAGRQLGRVCDNCLFQSLRLDESMLPNVPCRARPATIANQHLHLMRLSYRCPVAVVDASASIYCGFNLTSIDIFPVCVLILRAGWPRPVVFLMACSRHDVSTESFPDEKSHCRVSCIVPLIWLMMTVFNRWRRPVGCVRI